LVCKRWKKVFDYTQISKYETKYNLKEDTSLSYYNTGTFFHDDEDKFNSTQEDDDITQEDPEMTYDDVMSMLNEIKYFFLLDDIEEIYDLSHEDLGYFIKNYDHIYPNLTTYYIFNLVYEIVEYNKREKYDHIRL